MPPETLISGAEGVVTINSDPVVVGQTFDFATTRNVMQKSFVGQAWGHSLAGQRRASFSASGSVSVETHPNLIAAFEAGSVPITVQIGTAAGPTDAGIYSGTFNLSDVSVTVNGDGEWDWSLTAESDGVVTYTPPGS
jgi:predicted secreted protein